MVPLRWRTVEDADRPYMYIHHWRATAIAGWLDAHARTHVDLLIWVPFAFIVGLSAAHPLFFVWQEVAGNKVAQTRKATLAVIRGLVAGRRVVPRIRSNHPFPAVAGDARQPVTSTCLPMSQQPAWTRGPNVCRACRRILRYPIRSRRGSRQGGKKRNSQIVPRYHEAKSTTAPFCIVELPGQSLGRNTARSRYHGTACKMSYLISFVGETRYKLCCMKRDTTVICAMDLRQADLMVDMDQSLVPSIRA
ncbi:hypothetical protein BO71DRAFT_170163 [Aspergillus ellipticus CBS 707.79]|uniref:Uncharacterized protein n=1 Tax=Aspergillus ellipticus CBS 707.79 TaxID=1448320 RepID=A0A319DQ54_9EURO|nr:hypothetical protein BO71DRAFT_170163 [Aspergillus ellipticus CBS 707.79]